MAPVQCDYYYYYAHWQQEIQSLVPINVEILTYGVTVGYRLQRLGSMSGILQVCGDVAVVVFAGTWFQISRSQSVVWTEGNGPRGRSLVALEGKRYQRA